MMQEAAHQSAPEIARGLKSLVQGLKDAIKKNEMLDKDVEFHRKRLRAQYLKLLLLHPDSKEAKDIETHLWMQTSYPFISSYKQRIATLDAKLFSPHPPKHRVSHQAGGGGHVEYRKTLARFRQFLAEEEKFYMLLLIRFRNQFDLVETQPALVQTEIIGLNTSDSHKSDLGRNIFPEQVDLFSLTSEQRSAKIAIFCKLLVCVGDIARYRERYNDGGNRPRAGHEEGFTAPRNNKGGKKAGYEHNLARPRNYTRAKTIYEQARLLSPDDGNASHQLGILASYQKDSFGSMLHYYRALCVRQPYDTASDNLMTVLKKALEQHYTTKSETRKGIDMPEVPKVRVDRLKGLIVVLHAQWYLDTDESAKRATSLARKAVTEFTALISERNLPTGLVLDIVVVALCSLWKLRMIRDSKTNILSDRKLVEPLMLSCILDLSQALFVTSTNELLEKPEDIQDKEDLAQYITATFRRILPAIRIISKWLRSNFSYIETVLSPATVLPSLSKSINDFWKSYVDFLTILKVIFPAERLPSLEGPLEEDVEMSGFSPIKKSMFNRSAPTENGLVPGTDKDHPNEEFLMRICDVLMDANLIVQLENSPIRLEGERFVCTGTTLHVANGQSVASLHADSLANIMDHHPDPPRAVRDSDDDDMTQTSRTGDDVIREAFDTALAGDEDDIVWSLPRSSSRSLFQPDSQSHHLSHQSLMSGRPTTSMSPPRSHLPPSMTTAQDLLMNVLTLPPTVGGISRPTESSAPQPSLLFGSGSPIARTTSIWTPNGLGPSNITQQTSVQQQQNFDPAPGHGRSRSVSHGWNSPHMQAQRSQSDFVEPSLSTSLTAFSNDDLMRPVQSNVAAGHHYNGLQAMYHDTQFYRVPAAPARLRNLGPLGQDYVDRQHNPMVQYGGQSSSLIDSHNMHIHWNS